MRHLVAPGFQPSWHQHREFELNFILSGQGVRRVGSAMAAFGPGDIVLVPPGLPHSWASQDDGALAEAIVVMFAPDLLRGQPAAPEWTHIQALLDEMGAASLFEDPDGDLAQLLRSLVRLNGAPRLIALLQVLDLLANRPRQSLGGSTHLSVGSRRDLECVRRVLDALGPEPTSLPKQSALAASLGMSPSQLSRVFKRATGRTLSDHVEGLRLDQACRLLQGDVLRVAEVCYAAGFSNLSNFNRRFRAAYGATPSAYRRSFRADMAAARSLKAAH